MFSGSPRTHATHIITTRNNMTPVYRLRFGDMNNNIMHEKSMRSFPENDLIPTTYSIARFCVRRRHVVRKNIFRPIRRSLYILFDMVFTTWSICHNFRRIVTRFSTYKFVYYSFIVLRRGNRMKFVTSRALWKMKMKNTE